MTHCTVCGAAAREGAKFCTSCGARLVDTVSAAPGSDGSAAVAAVEPVAEPSVTDLPGEPSSDQPDSESTWATIVSGDATGEVERVPAEPVEPAAVVADPAESPEYAASWPGAEDGVAETPAGDAPDDEPPAPPEAPWSSWSNERASTATGPAPESFATDAGQDPEPHPVLDSDDGEAVGQADVPEARDGRDGMEASHHGASQWESWAPTVSGEATVPTSSSDVGASVRRLLDDLADRIDRLIDPAAIERRGVDADELADQLERWSNARTDADGLLEVVRAVRTSPRDVDALTRLADRAPDLELLVRHYQAITGSAGGWASKLRDQSAADPDDA